jgi:hypothetical protein
MTDGLAGISNLHQFMLMELILQSVSKTLGLKVTSLTSFIMLAFDMRSQLHWDVQN